MAAIDARMTIEIAEAGAAGAVVFAWIDEWFKQNWVTIDYELPAERSRLWLDRMDAEEQYGMVGMAAEPPVAGATLAGRLDAWRALPPVLADGGTRLRVAHDAAYLWVLAETPARAAGDRLMIGFDLIDPRAGDRRLPGAVGPRLPVGVEMALVDDGATVR